MSNKIDLRELLTEEAKKALFTLFLHIPNEDHLRIKNVIRDVVKLAEETDEHHDDYVHAGEHQEWLVIVSNNGEVTILRTAQAVIFDDVGGATDDCLNAIRKRYRSLRSMHLRMDSENHKHFLYHPKRDLRGAELAFIAAKATHYDIPVMQPP